MNQFLSNAYIWLKLGPFINIMQHFKHSDNDIQIWMTENDNIIEKVRFSDVSTYLRCYSEEKLECGGTEKPNIYIVS